MEEHHELPRSVTQGRAKCLLPPKPGAFSFQIVLECNFPLSSTCPPRAHLAVSPLLNQIPALWYLQVPVTFSYLEDVAKAISKACSIP